MTNAAGDGHSKFLAGGPSDGGSDGVVWRRPEDNPPVVILQSKFSDEIGEKKFHKSASRDFRRVVDALHSRDGVFDEFLEDVAPEIRKFHLKAFKQLAGNWLSARKAFRILTTLEGIPRFEFSLILRASFMGLTF